MPCYDPWCDSFVDIVAINPSTPASIYHLTGFGVVLGNPLFRYGTVHIHRHVTSWLTSPGDLCVLNWEVARDLFAGEPRLTMACNDREQAIEVLTVFGGIEGVVPRIVYNDTSRLAA